MKCGGEVLSLAAAKCSLAAFVSSWYVSDAAHCLPWGGYVTSQTCANGCVIASSARGSQKVVRAKLRPRHCSRRILTLNLPEDRRLRQKPMRPRRVSLKSMTLNWPRRCPPRQLRSMRRVCLSRGLLRPCSLAPAGVYAADAVVDVAAGDVGAGEVKLRHRAAPLLKRHLLRRSRHPSRQPPRHRFSRNRPHPPLQAARPRELWFWRSDSRGQGRARGSSGIM